MTEQFRVRSLTLPVYVPNLLFAVGQGAVVPIIALLALDLGASPAAAGAIVALRGVGTLVFDVPAGVLVAKVGEKKAMMLATVALTGIAIGIGFTESLLVYAFLIVAMGSAWSVWALARFAYATESSPLEYRGRVMSMMGGVTRLGLMIGPILGGVVIVPLGLSGAFAVQAVVTIVAVLTLVLSPAPEVYAAADRSTTVSLRDLVRDHRRTFGTAGVATALIHVLRSSRQAIIPLWGDYLGVGASQISFIFSASSAIEMVVFYPMGMLMDRKGRKWAALPCVTLLSLGIAMIPFTNGLTSLAVVGLLIGLANGLGSGINMTLGSDFSPSVGRSEFLGLWRLVGDFGTAGGPLLVAGVTSMASLAAAAWSVGALGLVASAIILLAVPETLPPTTPRSASNR